MSIGRENLILVLLIYLLRPSRVLFVRTSALDRWYYCHKVYEYGAFQSVNAVDSCWYMYKYSKPSLLVLQLRRTGIVRLRVYTYTLPVLVL